MNRRDFLGQLMAGSAALGAYHAFAPSGVVARQQPTPLSPATGVAPLRLAATHHIIDVHGKAARVFGLGTSDRAPGLTLDAGGAFDVALANNIDAPTLVHWHGLTPPWGQDGVPDNPAALLKPGEVRCYSAISGSSSRLRSPGSSIGPFCRASVGSRPCSPASTK